MKNVVKLESGNYQESESNYECIVRLVNTPGVFAEAVRRGLIPYTIMEHKEVYECYLSHIKAGKGKELSYQHTGCDCRLSRRQVIRIVNFMQS